MSASGEGEVTTAFSSALIDAIPDGIYELDAEGHFEAVNDVIVERTGYDRSDLLGEHVSMLLDDADVTRLEEEIRQLLGTNATNSSVDITVHTADGDTIPCEIHLSLVRDEDGAFLGSVGAAREISDRLEYEAELKAKTRAAETELSTVVDRISDAFYALDSEFRFTHVNERAEELLGASEDDLIGQVLWEAYPEAAEVDEVWEAFHDALEDQETTRYKTYYPPLEFWVEATVYPSETGVSVYFRDVTEQVERQQELELYEASLETIWDGVATLDEEGHFVMVNDAFCALSGYDREALMGSHVTMIHSEDTDREAAELSNEVEAQEREMATLEFELLRRDGERITVEGRFGPFTFEDGSMGRTGVIRDISDRKDRHRELQEYETIVETMTDGVYVLDDQYRFIHVNEAYEEMTGYDREELLGSHCSLVVGEDISSRAAEESMQLATEHDTHASLEADILRRDGDRLPAESRFTAIRADDGNFQGTVGVVRDLRERKARETELERYETIVETVNDGIYTVDDEGRFTWVNDRYAEMLGYAPNELIGEPVSQVVDPSVAEHAQSVEAAMRDGTVEAPTVEAQLITASGQRFPAEATFAIFETEIGHERVGVARDITERKHHEKQLQRHREQLAALNQLNEATREIVYAVIESSTRSRLEELVTKRLVDHYHTAWMGTIERGGNAVTIESIAGDFLSVDPDYTVDLNQQGPITTAYRTLTPQFVHRDELLHIDEPLVDETVEAVAAIPVVHDDRVFGVLAVYTASPQGFSSAEADILSHLGLVIGHAIHAMMQHEALVSDAIIELEMRVEHPVGDPFAQATRENDGTITFDRTIRTDGDHVIQFVHTTGMDPDAMVSLGDDLATIEDITLLNAEGDRAYFEIRMHNPPLTNTIASYGGRITELTIQDGELRLLTELPQAVPLREAVGAIRQVHEGIEIVAQRTRERDSRGTLHIGSEIFDQLTAKQQTALETAYFSGFFDWPRTTTGEEVADMLDLSPATFTEHLRIAERKIFEALLADPK